MLGGPELLLPSANSLILVLTRSRRLVGSGHCCCWTGGVLVIENSAHSCRVYALSLSHPSHKHTIFHRAVAHAPHLLAGGAHGALGVVVAGAGGGVGGCAAGWLHPAALVLGRRWLVGCVTARQPCRGRPATRRESLLCQGDEGGMLKERLACETRTRCVQCTHSFLTVGILDIKQRVHELLHSECHAPTKEAQ